MAVTLAKRQFRLLAGLLVLSLALNLGLGGWFLGQALTEPSPPPRWHERMMAQLPPADAAIMRESFERHAGEATGARAALQDARQKADAIVARQPFDPAALDAQLAEARRLSLEYQTVMHRAYAEGVARLSPEARVRLAERERR